MCRVSVPHMSERGVRLRLFMRLNPVESANLAADVKRVRRMVEAFLSAPALAAVTKVQEHVVGAGNRVRPLRQASGIE